jgi:hypothetical protein
MRKKLLFILGIGIAGGLSAQSISPEVQSSAGETNTVGTTSVSWTIGEPAITTATGTSAQISQGFHQPQYVLVALEKPLTDGFTIDVFPNPASDRVFLQFDREENSKMEVQLITLNGKIISSQSSFALSEKLEFDLSSLSQGNYLVRVRNESGQFDAYKIQKIN